MKGMILMINAMKSVGLYRYLPVDHPESLIDVNIPKPKTTDHDVND
jgi:hypothetical protein